MYNFQELNQLRPKVKNIQLAKYLREYISDLNKKQKLGLKK